MSRLKRFLAMAMVVIMVIGLLPVSALAVDAGGYDAGGFTGGWSLKSEDTQADTWSISGPSTVEVGSTITLEGTEGDYSNSWSSSNKAVATVSGSDETAVVTGVSAGTVTITHTYKKSWRGQTYTETFTVTVTAKSTVPVTSLNIVEESVTIYAGPNYGASLHAVVDPDEATITWSSSDTSVATVDSTGKVTGVSAGTATITATAGGLTDTCEVTVNATSGKTMVYIYLNAANLGDYNFPNLTANSSGWYTIGYVALASAPTASSGNINDTIRSYVRDAVRHANNASIPTEFLLNIVETYDLKIVSSGANDYLGSGNAWHLDLYAPASTTTYPVTINYINEGTGDIIESTSGNYAYGAEVDADWYKKTISGYTYVSANPASITVIGDAAQDVINLYYKKNGSITVTLNNDTVTYDGQEHSLTGAAISGGPAGLTTTDLHATISDGTGTDVGTYAGTITGDAQYTSNGTTYDVIYKGGTLTINPATLTVTTPSDSKVYDGDPLTAEGSITGFVNGETATFETTGSQTAVGNSQNTYSLTWNGSAKKDNYTISETIGTLTVSEYAGEITVTTTGGEFTYDGGAHGATVSVSTLPKGYTLETATSDDTATHVADGTVTANCDTLVIKNAAGEDVTDKLNIKYVDGSIKINPATLTVVTPSKSKTYDGTALTAAGSITGFVNGETATFTTTGTQTEVGSSDNTYKIVWDGSAVESDYTISESLGTLTVSEYAGEITVTTTGGTFTYDGQAHGATVSVSSLPTGYTLESATSNATATNVTSEAVTAKCDTLVIRNAAGVDVTGKLKIKYVDGSITITPATLTVTTPSASKVYDGDPLTAEGSITGFVNDENATFTTTGTQTAVGSSTNTYEIVWNGTAVEGNYKINESLGTLTVTENADEIVVTTTGGTFTYDGEAHGATVSVSELPKGYTLETATSDDTATHVAEGTVTANCDTLVIKNAQDVDVTSKLNIKYVDGSITIKPATLTVTTDPASKVYDGDPLTATGAISGFVKEETATFTTTGTQTAVGSSDNTYSLNWNGTAVESDYSINESLGKLTVSEYAGDITVTTTGGEFPYDGEAHGATVAVSELPKGYTLETATSSATATHVAEGTVTATCDTLVIKNAQGVDVTGNLKIKYVNGSIKINPTTLTITTPDASKTYDGDPLTAAGTISGFVKEETAAFTTTGAQTAVGSSSNTYSLTWNGTATVSDYTISESIGTLTVTEYAGEITVTTTGGTFTYDGEAHGATVSVSTLPTGYTLETATSNDTATHVNDGTVTANCDTLVIKNAQGEDVTSKLSIKYVDGSITITPATLTITTPDASKVYDGTALTAAGSISGFVKDETATFTTTGSQTAVDSSKNTYSLNWNGSAAESDYTISESIGTLTVTENTAEIVVTTTGGTFTYDGEAHGATVSVSTLPTGYTLETATSNDTATHVADGTVEANCDALVIKNAQGVDVTSKLNIKKVDGSITITPATLTVTTPDASKVYDSEALTAAGSISGFVKEETATFQTTGSQTEVGSSKNTYSVTWNGTATESDYTINESVGTLTVTENDDEIVVTTTGGEFTYDGNAHGATVSVSTLPKGYTLVTATSNDTATHVAEGTVTANCDTLVIRNAKGENVTSNLNIKYVDGSITITPATLTVTTPDASKVYDGDPLTAAGSISGFVKEETATFTTTGTQTEVGSSDNTYSLTFDGTAVESDYTVEASLGTLMVSENTAEITVTTTGGTFTYDGEAHGATVEVSTLPKGYTLETATSDDTATHVADGTVTANCDTLIIRNAAGEDVTSKLNITYVDGGITITPATLTVVTNSANKTYDGDPLTAAGSITGFVKEENATFTTTGSQTEVGSSDNTYSLAWDGSAVESDYTISDTVGTLTVTEYAGKITVTTTGGEYTYDGNEHGATVSVSTLPKGYTLETATSNDTATHVAEGAVTANCDTLVIKNAAGENVTSKLTINYVNGSIKINPATLTVTTPDASKVYDGTALTAAGSISGFVNGETATFTTTGTQTEVGNSKNTYSLTFDGTAAEGDYTISDTVGTLTVTENTAEITVTTTGGTFTYDGEAHGATVEVSTLPTGYTLETATSSAKATHVADGPVTAKCDTLVIKNAQGVDVTEKLNIKYVNGSITITPATLTVTTPDASKVYDSDPLTAEGSISGFVKEETATFTTTGSRTEVGSSDNTYKIDWNGTAAESDYTINATIGKLTVTEYADEIVVTTTGGEFTYDGKAHGATVTVSTLPTGYTLETATSSATATGVTKEAVTATCNTLVIRNAAGEDVTDKLEITYVNGSIKINPATLTVTTPDASKVYDGDPLTAAGSISGFVSGESATFTTTGIQTEVGNSKNTYEIDWNGASALSSNYTISENLGTLTVTENDDEIVVTTTGGTFTYDGEAHGATVSVSTLPKGYTLVTATSDDTATHVADGTVAANCDTLVIKNAQGVDVTDNLNIKYVDGSITINPALVTVTADAQSKTYGDKDPKLTAAVSGTIGSDTITYDVTRAAGEDVDEYDITVSGDETQGNYKVSYVNNTLTITPRTLTITTESASKPYNKTPLTAGVKSVDGAAAWDTILVEATGSQTLVGYSDNTYKIDWGSVKSTNYTVVSTLGILTVTDGSATLPVHPDDVITKTHEETKYGLGDTVTFTISVTNIYATAKTITITEQEGVTLAKSVFENVAAGVTVSTTATYIITEKDILDGEFKNVATVSFSGEEKTFDGEDTVDEIDDPNGSVSVTKRVTNTPANGTAYALGETITYAIVVKNDGNLTLTDLTVEDELTGDSWTIESLAPGEEETYTTSYTVTEDVILAAQDTMGVLTNTVNASGKSPDETEPSAEDEIESQIVDPNGHMTVTKTTTSTPENGSAYVLGETIGYKITVKNDGNLTLTGILVTDELTGDSWTIDSLAPGEESEEFTAEYTVTEADVLAGEVTNVATAAGESEDDEKPGVTPGEKDDPVQKQGASISVVKAVTSTPAEGGTYALGETIEYKITVTNNGDITVENITVEDELTGDSWEIASLAPGAVETYTASYEVTEDDILAGEVVNVATASGKSEDPDAPNPEDQGEITADVDDPNGSVSVTKTVTSTPADGSKYALGETITYAIVVENNGNLTLTGLTVEDELTGDTWTIDSLAPGAVETYTASYTVTAADIANGGVTNVAVAEGESPDGTNPEGKDEITSDTEDPNAHLTIVKTVTSETPERGYYDIGETITYQIVVTNDGNVDLTNVVTTDELTGESWTAASLKVGESATYTTSYVVQESDAGTTGVVNTATVSGEGPATDPDDPEAEDSTDPAPVVQYYTLTVNYVYEDGTPAAATEVRTLLPGAIYNIPSPAISNYTPNAAFVAGTMAASNLTVTITYTANAPAPTPTQPEPTVPPVPPVVIDTPEQQVVITPDPEQGVLIEEDDNGDIVVTQISEDEVPLADLDLDDHKDCVLHTLFLLAALIVLAVYTSRAKKLQAEIQELTEKVEIEKKKREGQSTDEDHE